MWSNDESSEAIAGFVRTARFEMVSQWLMIEAMIKGVRSIYAGA